MRIGWLVRDNYLWNDDDEDSWNVDNEDSWIFIDGDNVPSFYREKKMIVYDFVENVDD